MKFIEAQLVYSSDKFDVIKGTESTIMHRPWTILAKTGVRLSWLLGSYFAKRIKQFDVMPVSRIDEINNDPKHSNPKRLSLAIRLR